MAIDLSQNLIPLSKAARSLPRLRGDRPVSPATLWRWAAHGLRGVKLEIVRVGGTTCTSPEALQRFFSALNEEQAPTPASNAARQQRAADQLEAVGI